MRSILYKKEIISLEALIEHVKYNSTRVTLRVVIFDVNITDAINSIHHTILFPVVKALGILLPRRTRYFSVRLRVMHDGSSMTYERSDELKKRNKNI